MIIIIEIHEVILLIESRKNSRKRNAILEAMRGTKSHPSAQWVYDSLRSSYPELSLATVYRNIKLFERSGEIISVAVVDGQERYDACVLPHSHFICRGCAAVIDLDFPEDLENARDRLESEEGFKIESVCVSYKGLCRHCL